MISFEINDNPLNGTLRGISGRLSNFSEPLAEASLLMERNTKLRFAREIDPTGKAWAPLKPSTLKAKKTSAILRETGRLANSIIAKPPTATEVEVSDATDYGVFLQRGTRRMKARPFLGFSEGDIQDVQRVFGRYLG